MRKLGRPLLLSLVLGGCAHVHSPFVSQLPHSPVRVSEVTSSELSQGAFDGGSPPQSLIAPLFLGGDDLLVVTMGGAIQLLDLKTLTPRWGLPLNIGAEAQPLVVGSFVYVAGMDAIVRKIRVSTGEIAWSAKIPAESPGGIAASQGLIYVTAGDDSLTALDEKTGSAVWSYKRPAHESNVLWSLLGCATPVVSLDGKSMYLGFSDGAFVALETSSGKTLWERNFDRPGRFKDVDTPPILSADGSVIYLSVVDGDMVVLRARDGSTLWSVPGAAATAPFVDATEKALYLSTRDAKLLKVSLEDNRIVWTANLGARGMGSKPVGLLNDFIALTTTHAGVVVVQRSDGKILWEKTFALGTLAPPSFDGRRLAVLSSRNVLHIYTVEKRM